MDEKKKSLRISVVEGAFASAMTGFTQDYLAPFLLFLGGTAQHISFLSALPNLAASLVQLKSVALIEYLGSRKRMMNLFVLLQALSLLPMIFLALFSHNDPMLFVICVILFTCFGSLATPAWGSLMSDLVDPEKRGHYFGSRNRILGFTAVVSTFVAGLILHSVKAVNVFYAFTLIFFIAFILRMISWQKLRQMYEPPLHVSSEDHFTFFQFLRRLKHSNFAKFVVFAALMSFSANVASPFFAVFMLKDLKFDYLMYTIVTLSANLTIHSTISRWGRHADSTGNLKIIRITAPLIGVIPLLWLWSHNPVYLIGAQIFSGFLWSGYNICTSNFIFDAVTPGKRTRCIAYFNTLNGVAVCCGAIFGGVILLYVPPLFGYKMLSLFTISAILRLVVGFFLPRYLSEVRPVQPMKSNEIFCSMIGIKPIIGVERKTIRY
jgi:Na+/melibiose symporter-like transporter